MKGIIDTFVQVVVVEATNVLDYQHEVNVSAKTQKDAKKLLTADKERVKFVNLGDGCYEFRQSEWRIYSIELGRECSCRHFQKNGMCFHYAAVALLERVSLRGMPISKVLVTYRRRVVTREVDDLTECQLHQLNELDDS